MFKSNQNFHSVKCAMYTFEYFVFLQHCIYENTRNYDLKILVVNSFNYSLFHLIHILYLHIHVVYVAIQCCESNDLDEIEYWENILVDAHLMLYRSFKVRLKNTSSGFIWVRGLSQLAEKSSKTWCILSAGGRGWLRFCRLIFCSAKKNGIIVCSTQFCN